MKGSLSVYHCESINSKLKKISLALQTKSLTLINSSVIDVL